MELSFKRLGLLIKKQFIENRKFYLFGALAMMGVMGFIFIFSVYVGSLNMGKQGIFLGIGMVTFGCLFTLTLFSKLDKKEQRIQMLMLPSTALEKLLGGIIYGAVLFPVVYLITVYPVLRFANYVDNNFVGNTNEPYAFDVEGMQAIFVFIFYIMQTLVLMFSVFIRQYKVPVAAGVLSFLFFGTIYLNPKITNQFLPRHFSGKTKIEQRFFDENKVLTHTKTITVDKRFQRERNEMPFTKVRYFYGDGYAEVNPPRNQRGIFGLLLLLAIPFMWIITLFRLKESELSQ